MYKVTYKKENTALVISALIVIGLIIGAYFILKKNPETNQGVISECLKLHEQFSPSVKEGAWEAVEIGDLGNEPISINNLGAKKFQEAAREKKDIQANYGPFIMEKRLTRDGPFVQETNPELIRCSKDRIIISIWQP